ncbi:hypothetical protein B566_EDAN011805, partial [Ephemera danica]
MDWLESGAQLQNTGSQLGMQVGSTYRVQDTCLDTLSELLGKLASEDRTLRTFRRALGFSQIIQKDLVPLLIQEKDDLKIMDAVVRLLVNLTIPVECLLPMEIMARSDAGRHTIFELNSLLAAAKEAFIEPRSTRSILQFMKKLLESEERLSLEQCEGINNCLLLVRNILHIPEPWPLTCQNSNNSAQVNATTTSAAVAAAATATPSSKQNVILWNLFAQGVDKVLIHLMTCPQKKLLNLWFEASLSESSEDNESNTSPPEQGSGDSSPMLTSDPTSDSSDNSSGRTNKSGTSSDNNGAAKHGQRSHSSEHAKSNTK